MKSHARFKAGAKGGSNYHNPVKYVATFWAGQSDYELQSMPVSHACVTSVDKSIIVSGTAASFSDSVAAALLVKLVCMPECREGMEKIIACEYS